jgi:tetratricopeptide (TPR) repeat protein
MKKLILFVCCHLPFFLFTQNQKGAAPIGNHQSPVTGTTRAVVIGISDYQDVGIPDLRFAVRDAQAFAVFLQSKAGSSLPPENIKLLLDEQATTGNLVAAFGWLIDETKPGDQCIIYFSGHGDVETKTRSNLGFLLTWNSPPRAYIAGAYAVFFLQEVVITLSLSNKAKVLLITDACRAGKLAGNPIGGAQLTNANLATQFANEIKILSCQPNEFSLEGEQWGGGRGVFSYYLTEGLYGLADNNGDAAVTVLEIGRYLEDKVPEETAPLTQNPLISGLKTERLSSVDAELLADLKAQKNKDINILARIENKGFEETVLAQTDTTLRALYSAFEQALQSKAFFEPPGVCAEDLYNRLTQEPSLAALHNTMRRNYAAALQDDAQAVLLNIFKEDPRDLESSVQNRLQRYESYPKRLNRAAGLLGEKHYMYRSLQARRAFFEAYFLHLSNPLTIEGQPIHAIRKKCEEANSWEPEFPFSYWLLTYEYGAYGRQSDSCSYFANKATELAPSWTLPLNHCGLLHFMALEKYPEAAKYLDRALEIDSCSAVTWAYYGMWHSNLKNPAEAERCYLHAIRCNPEYALPYFQLMAWYWETKNYRAAESLLMNQLEAKFPKDGVYYNLACLYALEGYVEKAFELLVNACEAGWENVDWMQQDPDLASLREQTERWQILMRKYFSGKFKD